MLNKRPFCLSIAGFDPCAGAGILADIKTFESFGVYGMGVITSNTFQTDNEFVGLEWIELDSILKQQKMLMNKYHFESMKIGLVNNFDTLQKVIQLAKKANPSIHIVWDPILASSSGYSFHSSSSMELQFVEENCTLITPNYEELKQLWDIEPALFACQFNSALLLKGGHRVSETGTDILFSNNASTEIPGVSFHGKSKHGTGCVLSAAIAANLAKGENLKDSCTIAKTFVEKFILSNNSNLGFHEIK